MIRVKFNIGLTKIVHFNPGAVVSLVLELKNKGLFDRMRSVFNWYGEIICQFKKVMFKRFWMRL